MKTPEKLTLENSQLLNRKVIMKKQLLTFYALITGMFAMAQNPYPIITIDSVQFVSDSKLTASPVVDVPDYISPTFKNTTFRDTVRFDGIVVSNPLTYGLSATLRKAAYIQKEGGGPWSGVLVMCDPATTPAAGRPTLAQFITETKFYENFVPGYKVRVSARFAAFQNETQMNLLRNNANWSNAVEQLDLNTYQPVYSVITVDSLMTGNQTAGTWTQQKARGEKWEGVLVEIRNVRVTNVTPFGGTRWNWSIIDDAGNELVIRDMSSHFRNDDNEDTIPKIPNVFVPPVAGTGLSYIRGIITEYTVGNIARYGIIPLNPADVGPCNICPPRIGNRLRTPIVPTANDSVTITARITGDTALASVNLSYAKSDTNVFFTIPMVKDPLSDNFSAKIPPYPAGTLVKYFIRAIDGRNISIVVPDTLATGQQHYVTANGINNIRDIQFTAAPATGASIWNGDSIPSMNVTGVVTATRMNNQTIIQDGQGVNSAIFVQNSDATQNWKIGDSILITAARVSEVFNVTTLFNPTATIIKSNATLPAFEMNLPIDSFRLNRVRYARPWEGVLMSWDSVYVAQTNADSATNGQFGEWAFSKDSTANLGLRVDDLNASILNMNRDLTKGQFFEYVKGAMFFSFSNFKLIPRMLSDVGLCGLDTFAPVITLNGNEFDTVEVGSGTYNDVGATAFDNRDGNLTGYLSITGTVNTAQLGNYVITYATSDFCGNSESITRNVHVKDTPNVGLRNNLLSTADINVFPNPAHDVVNITVKGINKVPVTVTMIDMLGRTLLTRTYHDNQVKDTINISNLNNGVYFCEIKNAEGSRTIKFVVSGK
jgi:hypothetical protein